MIIITGDFNMEFLKDNKKNTDVNYLMNSFNLQHYSKHYNKKNQ